MGSLDSCQHEHLTTSLIAFHYPCAPAIWCLAVTQSSSSSRSAEHLAAGSELIMAVCMSLQRK